MATWVGLTWEQQLKGGMKVHRPGFGDWGKRLIVIMLFWVSIPVLAQETDTVSSWHQESENFRVYLGVVPVELIKRKPILVDDDKTLHGGAAQQSPYAYHIMVAVFDKESNDRVKNATVIAKVGPRRLFGSKGIERPLERMKTSETVSYGNFFEMSDSDPYEIEIRIYRPNGDHGESVEFVFQKP